MIKNVVRNILLLITKINEQSLQCYLTSFPVALYYPNIIYLFKNLLPKLNFNNIDKHKNIFTYYEEKHEELYDTILYLNDLLLCQAKNIKFVLINCLLNEIIFPLLNIIMSDKKELISITQAIYILSLLLFYIKNDFIVDLISYFLFQEKIPLILLEKIKKYKFLEMNKQFMYDINYLIKNINDADINNQNWKRNADIINKSIGLNLSTGKVEEDNNYHYFKNYLNNIKKKDENYVENKIFRNIQELLTSKDENIILYVIILIYIVIDYYYKYFQNYKDNKENEDNEDNDLNENINENNEISRKNNIRNSGVVNNNLRNLNKNINNNNIKLKKDIFNNKTIFNPFLMPFFNILEKKINNNQINLFERIIQIIKKKLGFHICTNEILLNIIKLLIKIYLIKQEYSSNYILNTIIITNLEEEINELKKLIINNKCNNFYFYSTISAYKYYQSETIETKVNDLMKSYYILISFHFLKDNDTVPISLKDDKTEDNILRNHMINIFLYLDIIQIINFKNKSIQKLYNNNKNNKFCPFELEKDIEFYKDKIYKKEELGKEYGFCFISNKIEDFKNNLSNIKKCVFIITKYNFNLGEIQSNTFKDLSKIKIFKTIPLRNIKIRGQLNKDNFIEIMNTEDKKNKIIMNCFNPTNKQKTNNYLTQMIDQCISFEKSLFDTFLDNIENKVINNL